MNYMFWKNQIKKIFFLFVVNQNWYDTMNKILFFELKFAEKLSDIFSLTLE